LTLRVRATEVRARWNAPESAYFRALADGSFDRDDFVETQVQFLFAVAHFAKPMEILAARMATTERTSLLENIADEHGRGDPTQSHEQTFLELLSRLGVGRDTIAAHGRWPEVDAFNAALDGVCTTADPHTAVAALAIIEDIFAELSALIGRALQQRGWLTKSEIVHYATHEVLDVHHADAFYALIETRFAEKSAMITRGLELGAYLFVRMYDDLHAARKRRWR
jgi:pyrroloquinoline-quinone synthase